MRISGSTLSIALLSGAFFVSTNASPADQKPAAPVSSYAIPIGATIGLDAAKHVAAAAAAEAKKNSWHMAIAVVDPAGTLIYFEKMDDTQIGSTNVAIDKARSAALFKRPTKAFQDAVAGEDWACASLGSRAQCRWKVALH